jgi:aminoglycoside phosphotransferase (APT) family kinase protein
LDIERPGVLADYLRERGLIGGRETPTVRVLAGGVSNRTVLVERWDGGAWVVKQALARLRVQAEWWCSPARIHREAAGLRTLNELLPPGATPQFVDEDPIEHVLIMEAVAQPHMNWKQMLLAGEVVGAHVAQFGALLGTMHGEGYRRCEEMAETFGNTTFFDALRLEPYYHYTAAQTPAAANFFAQLTAATVRRRQTLVHGDYSPKNVLVHCGQLVLLDYEVIHYGDPAFDLGFGLTHLLSKAHHLPPYRDRLAEAARQFWAGYLAALGDVPWRDELEPMAVRHTLGCLLARVDGRSPLEYLGERERMRQRAIVLALMAEPPETIYALTQQFTEGIACDADH